MQKHVSGSSFTNKSENIVLWTTFIPKYSIGYPLQQKLHLCTDNFIPNQQKSTQVSPEHTNENLCICCSMMLSDLQQKTWLVCPPKCSNIYIWLVNVYNVIQSLFPIKISIMLHKPWTPHRIVSNSAYKLTRFQTLNYSIGTYIITSYLMWPSCC